MRPALSVLFLLGILLAAPPCRPQSWCAAPRNPVFSKYEKLTVTDGWFEVYKLPGGVYALFELRQGQQVFSYLITGRKRALLFDSGLGIGRIDQVVRRLTSLPVVVLNSHTHFDHIGETTRSLKSLQSTLRIRGQTLRVCRMLLSGTN